MKKIKLHIEVTDEQAGELLACALDGTSEALRDMVEKNGTMRRELIRAEILRRLPQ